MAPLSDIRRATVGDIMTAAVTTLDVGATVADARATLLNTRGSALPIINGRQQPVGMVTKSDLVAQVSDDLPIAVLMANEVLTCEADTSVWTAGRQMRANQVHHVVVVADGVLVGIVSVFDLLELLDDIEPADPLD
jgi:CBS domain-containing protein